MILYKNVDICDLESILNKGILSLNKSGNDNWDDGRRGENSKDVVYLFKPLTNENSFPNYGATLLEVEVDDAAENQLLECDMHSGRYTEYIIDEVKPFQIKNIYIPELFKERIDLPQEIMDKITWCGMKANHYDNGKVHCPEEVLKQFAKTAPIMSADSFNFFRGKFENREMIDLYDVEYVY